MNPFPGDDMRRPAEVAAVTLSLAALAALVCAYAAYVAWRKRGASPGWHGKSRSSARSILLSIPLVSSCTKVFFYAPQYTKGDPPLDRREMQQM